MPCKFASSMLMEATALTEGVNAVAFRLRDLGVQSMLLLVGADNKQAVERLAARTITFRGGDLMDRMAADHIQAAQYFRLMYSWIPAQHDTGHQGLLSTLNKLVDKKSREAQATRQGPEWSWPQAWQDEDTLIWRKDGVLQLNLSRAIQAELQAWVPTVTTSTAKVKPNAHIPDIPERASLRRWWHASRLYHPRDMAAALLLAYYLSLRELYSDDQEQPDCPVCGDRPDCAVQHRLQECIGLHLTLETFLGCIKENVSPLLRHDVLWYRVWQGWLLESTGRGCCIVLQWCLPRDAVRVVTAWRQQGVIAWPLFHASFPSETCQQAMTEIMWKSTGRLPAIILHAIAEYARPHRRPQLASVQTYRRQWLWRLPVAGAAGVQSTRSTASRGLLVPLELIQVLASICPGLGAAIRGEAWGQEVFLEERPFTHMFDKLICAYPSSQWQFQQSPQDPSLRVHVARKPLTTPQQQSARSSQVVEQWMVVRQFVVLLVVRGSRSLEVVRRWDAVRQYLAEGPGILSSHR